MARKIEELKLDDDAVVVSSQQLPYEDAEDLLPEVAQLVSSVVEAIGPALASGKIKSDDDVIALLPMLGGLMRQVGGGRLRQLAPRLLKTTSVVAADESGEKRRYDLVKKDERAEFFELRPDLYFQILVFAGKVTFWRFFPATGRKKSSEPATTESP